ncbi:13258_t:CDS:10 [Gigaspora margarita]|uniref:13258_t:CDS:1 n=1 Tax=Gigaspora margarita TaxID=4874 RepID=A0ABN7UHX1_GIGMA|nr:13258_t:CDS:10 [Gigaspora margarita]
MDYTVPAHVEIDTYFSVIPISKWQHLDMYINFKLEDGQLHTALELYRSFCRSLSCIERGSYPKFVTDYAKNLKMVVKSKQKFFTELAEKIIERAERRKLMKENEIDIQEKQSLWAQAFESKALDDITNAITGIGKYKRERKRIRESNDDDEDDIETLNNEQTAIENYATSARELNDFWKFQKSIIEKLKTEPTLSYATDVESIIALASIMILRKNKRPAYILCTEKEWQMAFPHITYKFKMPTLIQVTVCSYMQPLIKGDSAEFEDLWRQNWSKVSLLEDQNDKRIFDSMQIITRNFFYNLPYGKNKNLSNEDTYVHRTFHVILEEIFHIENMQLVWSNEESSSSRNQRSGDGKTHGLKPDFRIISENENYDQSEILFGEIKPPKVENHKFVVNQALAKLANLMKDALDQGIHDETYGKQNRVLENYFKLRWFISVRVFS